LQDDKLFWLGQYRGDFRCYNQKNPCAGQGTGTNLVIHWGFIKPPELGGSGGVHAVGCVEGEFWPFEQYSALSLDKNIPYFLSVLSVLRIVQNHPSLSVLCNEGNIF